MNALELDLVVHATHEAGLKVGGIGAVLDGLLSEPAYNRAVKRTILVGPFNPHDSLEMERLYAPRNGFHVHYSAHDGIYDVGPELARALTQVELGYRVRLLYGSRKFGDVEHEVLLVDAHSVNPQAVNDLKFHLSERYGINSYRYERYEEYEAYMRAAEPSFAALQALTNQPTNPLTSQRNIIIAHEWLGLPLAFCARRHKPDAYRSVFYAHETATVRLLVEGHAGHDTRFYNAMYAARDYSLYLADIFGDQHAYFKHALINAAATFDGVFAVGDLVMDELRFLSPAFAARNIALVYNGVPSALVTLADRWHSKERLQQYAQNLFAFRPSWVFTHVTRMVLSKALWRDLRVMEQLDRQLSARGETAVLFALSSTIPVGRRSEDVWRWESEYGWPLGHRGDNGDLVGLEWDYFRAVEQFNHIARASRVVLVNQFGWSRDRCGARMPAEMEFADIRRGSDLEFGQSIYEPFGIGQVEPLTYGALCCLSNVCGCVGFINKSGGLPLANVVLADYVALPPRFQGLSLRQMLDINQWERDYVEANEASNAAGKIIARLPRDEAAAQRLLGDGYNLSQRMSWQVVVEEGLLPALATLF
jgi:hypothetical protein